MKTLLEKYKEEPVAVFCARYIYRGILKEISGSAILLSDPSAVEVSGSATATAPQTEDPIPSDLVIALGAIEIVCQPTWLFHDLERTKK